MNLSLQELYGLLSSRDDNTISDIALLCEDLRINCHLAVMRQPYMDYVMQGLKKVESRFSKKICAPYRCVNKGDIVLFKETGGAIRALSRVTEVKYYGYLNQEQTMGLMSNHKEELMLSEDFIEEKRESHFASIFYLGEVLPVPSIKVEKRDMRSWVVLNNDSNDRLF